MGFYRLAVLLTQSNSVKALKSENRYYHSIEKSIYCYTVPEVVSENIHATAGLWNFELDIYLPTITGLSKALVSAKNSDWQISVSNPKSCIQTGFTSLPQISNPASSPNLKYFRSKS